MTDLLLRLFVKDRKNLQKPRVRSAVGKLAGIVGICCNVLLFIAKMLLGIVTASVSITADALNNLSDAASSILTLLGFQLAKRPADEDHPYGHGRYEYLSGLAISVLILFIGFELAKSAIGKIITPVAAHYSTMSLVILVASMLVKLWMSGFFSKLGTNIDSSALKASAVDSRNDVIATAGVLAGCALERFFSLPADGYVGLTVSVFIFYSGLKTARETISPLLGAQADKDMIQKLSTLILSHEKVRGIHDLLIHDYGPGQCYASVHAEVSAKYDPITCHQIIDHIEAEVLSKLNIQLVIHFDPIPEDEAHIALQSIISQTVSQLDSSLSIHDLRMVENSKQPLICFDLTVPYGLEPDLGSLKSALYQNLPAHLQGYEICIQIDRV